MKMGKRTEKGKNKPLPILKIINQAAQAAKAIKLYPVLLLELKQAVLLRQEKFSFSYLQVQVDRATQQSSELERVIWKNSSC